MTSLGPSEQLEGIILAEKWKVERRLRRDYGATGETRSCGYRAISISGDRPAFVKAFDFRHEELEGDTDQLERMVRTYNYERDVHKLTTDKNLSRVTRYYESGKIVINKKPVHFIVCEWADGCLREVYPPGGDTTTLDQTLTILRDIASGIAQLHGIGIAHQDIKPSNAVSLIVDNIEKLKITDLGSCNSRRAQPPHAHDFLVGQPNYAPYELLYEQPPANWKKRRVGCDLFLLGNLCFTQIVGASLTPAGIHCIPEPLRHAEFGGDYREVIPHLVDAHDLIVPSFFEEKIEKANIRDELVRLVLSLCHPDYDKRGLAGELRLERVVSKLDLLATRARLSNHAYKK